MVTIINGIMRCHSYRIEACVYFYFFKYSYCQTVLVKLEHSPYIIKRANERNILLHTLVVLFLSFLPGETGHVSSIIVVFYMQNQIFPVPSLAVTRTHYLRSAETA